MFFKKPHFCARCGKQTNDWLETEYLYDLPELGRVYFCHSCQFHMKWDNLDMNAIVQEVLRVRQQQTKDALCVKVVRFERGEA